MKKVTDDIAKAFDLCVEALSLNELSRRTGIGIYTLRKFATRKTNFVREETWDKIYPVLRPYLIGEISENSGIPPRIGPPARRHHDLVDLLSDQKILLDVFGALGSRDQADKLEKLRQEVGAVAHAYELGSLSADENRLLGYFEALSEPRRQEVLLSMAEYATLEVRRQRKELF